MPDNKSAVKRNRQNELHRLRNRMTDSRVKTVRKKFLAAVAGKDKTAAAAELKLACKLIDSAANKGVYAKTSAARKKSRLHKLFNAMATGA